MYLLHFLDVSMSVQAQISGHGHSLCIWWLGKICWGLSCVCVRNVTVCVSTCSSASLLPVKGIPHSLDTTSGKTTGVF